MQTPIHPFILSGGAGTRLWPLSRRAYPKQFLKLPGPDSLLQSAAKRVAGALFAKPTVIGNQDHRFLIGEQLAEIGVAPAAVVLEPVGRNTAPAAAIAALLALRRDPGGLLMLLPSDHVIPDVGAFESAVATGVEAALDGAIVTFGVVPDSPHSGYGYIELGEPPASGQAARAKRFVEKPDAATAQAYLDSGRFLWNAGMFLASARALLEAFRSHAPEVLEACERALAGAREDLDFLRLDPEAYAQSPSISFDYAVMERAANVACAPLHAAWSDLGAWPALWQMADKDAEGNAAAGEGSILFHASRDCYAYTDKARLVLLGLNDVLAVATKDAVLIASKDQAQRVKDVVERLDAAASADTIAHERVHRPWGWFEGLARGERFQVKCIMVKPGGRLSLQSHYHRSEHWVVVRGTVKVTIGASSTLLSENQSTYIPIGERHRLENPGKVPAFLIEVQSGAYLGEDDIVRFDDIYGRAAE